MGKKTKIKIITFDEYISQIKNVSAYIFLTEEEKDDLYDDYQNYLEKYLNEHKDK